LYRYRSLADIGGFPAYAFAMAQRVEASIEAHLLIGTDEESEQWVKEIASASNMAFTVLSKNRYGDRSIAIAVPDLGP